MKTAGHPVYNQAQISCVCGNAFVAGSTLPSIRVEVCSVCHPFYTGKQRLNDTQGQVEKFAKSVATSQVKKLERTKVLENRASKVAKKQGDRPSLKDLLLQSRKGNS